MSKRRWMSVTIITSTLLAASYASAQDTAPEEAAPAEAAPAEAAAAPAEPASAEAGATDETAIQDALAGGSPVEMKDRTYYFVGARYRGVIIPKFMQSLFADGGATVYAHGFGPELAIRKNGFEYNLSAWLSFYSMDETPFKGKDDDLVAWEMIESELKLLYLTGDFLWSSEISPEFSFNYGLGAGLAIVFGSLTRVQAYPANGPASDPESYEACVGPNDPNNGFCSSADNDRFPGTDESDEPSWFGGGSKPVFFPWLALQTGFRFKPHRNFAGRFDVGFGTSGFFLGVAGDYGL